MNQPEPPVRLAMFADAASAPVCDGEVCYFPPVPAAAPAPEPEPEAGPDEPDRPQ